MPEDRQEPRHHAAWGLRGSVARCDRCLLQHPITIPQRPKSASTFGNRSNRENVPSSAISLAACRNPPHEVRARVPPTLIRRTPSCAASATVVNGALISRFTGLGETAETIAATCSSFSMRGA